MSDGMLWGRPGVVAGLEFHRDRVVARVRLVDGGGRVRTHKRSFSTMTVGVAEMAQWTATVAFHQGPPVDVAVEQPHQ
jgi:hypothetical protein